MGVYGNNYNERLVPVQESTTILNLTGFVLKPEFARKTRGEQYFYVNNRFIRNGYLNHAVTDAFEDLLPNNSFPSYFLLIEIDPAKIDINIHPTKTEIKFEDEKSVYAIIRAAVKRSLGKFSITPSLDFEQETAFKNADPARQAAQRARQTRRGVKHDKDAIGHRQRVAERQVEHQ